MSIQKYTLSSAVSVNTPPFEYATYEEYKQWLIGKQVESEQEGIVDGWKVPSTRLHNSIKFCLGIVGK